MVEGNPLISEQTQKMLKQMQLTWNDIEDNDETLGLNDLSLEQFRQELFDFFRKNEEFFKQMPNGVFTGFKFRPNKKHASMTNSIVAVLGYPSRVEDAKDHIYSEIHILHQPIDANQTSSTLQNRQEILNLLRYHKEENRYVPNEIEKSNPDELEKLSKAIGNWLNAQVSPMAINEIQNLFSNTANIKTISPERQKLEEKFKAENFDLITWFIITK
jgi:hypothetical protein